MIKTLIKCMDLITLPLAFGGVFLGAGISAMTGHFDFVLTSLCLIFVFFFMGSANITQRYTEYIGNRNNNMSAYIRYSQSDFDVPVKTLLKEGVNSLLIFSAIIGMGILAIAGVWAIWMAPFLLIILYLNCAGKHPLSHTPFNTIITFIMFGPVCTLFTFLLQYNHENQFIGYIEPHALIGPAIMSCTIGLLALNALLIYDIRSYNEDKKNGVNTIAVKLGKEPARIIGYVCAIAVTAIFCLGAIRRGSDYLSWRFIIPLICTIIDIWLLYKVDRVSVEKFVKMLKVANFTVMFYGLAFFLIYMIIGADQVRDWQLF